MPVFTVEVTSAGGFHSQDEHEAEKPIDAVAAVLTRFRHLTVEFEDYDQSNDPQGSYPGWSRVVISVDGQYDGNGKWRRAGDPPPTPLEQLAEVGEEVTGE
jgi:hypothetical protein